MIYMKMSALTALCYPEYTKLQDYEAQASDTENTDSEATTPVLTNRTLMKPPIVKMRLGELYGGGATGTGQDRMNTETMGGFIKSLSYSFPDESPWEIKQGYRVPKYVTADIGFQVIHADTPSLDFVKQLEDRKEIADFGETFYGINKSVYEDHKKRNFGVDQTIV